MHFNWYINSTKKWLSSTGTKNRLWRSSRRLILDVITARIDIYPPGMHPRSRGVLYRIIAIDVADVYMRKQCGCGDICCLWLFKTHLFVVASAYLSVLLLQWHGNGRCSNHRLLIDVLSRSHKHNLNQISSNGCQRKVGSGIAQETWQSLLFWLRLYKSVNIYLFLDLVSLSWSGIDLQQLNTPPTILASSCARSVPAFTEGSASMCRKSNTWNWINGKIPKCRGWTMSATSEGSTSTKRECQPAIGDPTRMRLSKFRIFYSEIHALCLTIDWY